MSPGCAAANASTGVVFAGAGGIQPLFGQNAAGGGFTFAVGDAIEVEYFIDTAVDPTDFFDLVFGDADNPTLDIYKLQEVSGDDIGLDAGSRTTIVITANAAVAAQTDVTLSVEYGTFGFVEVRVKGCLSAAAAAGAQRQILAGTAVRQAADLTLGRTRSLMRSPPAARGTAAQTASAGPAIAFGGAGQGESAPFGVWADFAWSRMDDTVSDLSLQADAFTLAAGADVALSSQILFGTSFSAGRATSAAEGDVAKLREAQFTISPYVAYQIDDWFSLQGLVGYGYAAGESERAGITGDYDSHRYFIAIEGGYFRAWDEFAFYAGLNALWGQSHTLAFTESDGTRVGHDRVDIGALSAVLQPSYLIDVDPIAGYFVEPFALLEFSHDFLRSRIAGAANDRNGFRFGGGANIFMGESASGAVEASRTVGVEKRSETNARATLRVDF